jgi:hypothetical protein
MSLPEFFHAAAGVASSVPPAVPLSSLDDLPLTGLPTASPAEPQRSFFSLLIPPSAEAEDLASITGETGDAALWRSRADEYAQLQARSARGDMVRLFALGGRALRRSP